MKLFLRKLEERGALRTDVLTPGLTYRIEYINSPSNKISSISAFGIICDDGITRRLPSRFLETNGVKFEVIA